MGAFARGPFAVDAGSPVTSLSPWAAVADRTATAGWRSELGPRGQGESKAKGPERKREEEGPVGEESRPEKGGVASEGESKAKGKEQRSQRDREKREEGEAGVRESRGKVKGKDPSGREGVEGVGVC